MSDMKQMIEQFHQTHFGGVHQTLFLMDTLEKEETFFSIRNGHLYRREGFYIYYDRHAAVKLKKMEHREEKPRVSTTTANTREEYAGIFASSVFSASSSCFR